MKIQALRELTAEELRQRLSELNDEFFNLNMRRSLKSLDNPLRLRQVRREIARIKTVLNEDSQGIRKLAEQRTSILGDAGSSKRADREAEK
ncbi:MAG: 50S ribosomal protein L29 [Candidatus Zixiibacteriota bacterium]|nr:MAG: 50S ribosomal protein L29 [candidate division Zixibacteria bacterium]